MQAQPQQLMTNSDILALANQLAKIITDPLIIELKEVKQKLQNIEQANAKQVDESLVWLNARDVADGLGIPLKRARVFIAMPNFPKAIGGKRALYKTGPWRASEVKQFFKINKSKV